MKKQGTYTAGKYRAGYLICKQGKDGVTRSANRVFNKLEDALRYADTKTQLQPVFRFSVRLQ